MTISIKATRANSGSGDPTSISGPTVIIKGATNTYTITDYDSFSVYEVTTSVGTVSHINETITLVVEAGEVANTLQLTVTRDGDAVVKDIAIGAQSIGTPTITSPASGSVDVSIPVTLLSSAFVSYPSGSASHVSSDWRVKNSSGTIIWQSIANTTNLTSITIPAESLNPATQYFAEVRYTGSAIGSSAYSPANQFTTSAVSIVRPSITSPVNGATGVGETPTFTSSIFTTLPAGSDTHASTNWRVKLVSSGAVIWASLNNTTDKTSIIMPSGLLQVSSNYTVEVQYNGTTLPASQWSVATAFTTSGTFAYGKYLAVNQTVSPFLTIYGQDIDTFTKLANPATLPTTSTNAVSFSADGVYLAVGVNASPFLLIYKRSGDTFTKLANPVTLPGGNARAVSFSADGTYLAVGHQGVPYLTLYKRDGDTFTKLSSPTAAATNFGECGSACFSADGTYLAVGHLANPYISIYKRSGDTFTKLANPATLPSSSVDGISFSPDGVYLAAGNASTTGMTVYKRSSDTFTALTVAGTLPANAAGKGVAFSPDGVYLAVAHTVAPCIAIYKRSGDTFTKLANPALVPTGDGYAVSFSADGVYLALAHSGLPRLSVYKRSSDTFSRLAAPAVSPMDYSTGVAFYPPVLGR